MSGRPEASNVNRRQFLAAAGSVAAAKSLAVGQDLSLAHAPLSAPVLYFVIIHVRNGSLSYTVSPPNDPLNMDVKVNDEIHWKVEFTSHSQFQAAILFRDTTPFVKNDGSALKTFQWSGGTAGGTAQTQGNHEYCVAVFDKRTQSLCLDDPKIIVGGTVDAEATIVEAQVELRDVKGKVESIEKKLRKAIEELK
jgi:hypothetical protein